MPKAGDRTNVGTDEYMFDGQAWVGITDPWTPHIVTVDEMKLMKQRHC